MSAYPLYATYPSVIAPTAAPATVLVTTSSLATALDDPLWSTPRRTSGDSGAPPLHNLMSAPLPQRTETYPIGTYSLLQAPSPDSTTSSATNSDYSYEYPGGSRRHTHEQDPCVGVEPSPALSGATNVASVGGYHGAAPVSYFASDGTVNSHMYDTTPRATPSKRLTQVPDAVQYGHAVSSYLPTPASSSGGGSVRSRRPAGATDLAPVSVNGPRMHPSPSSSRSVKEESPTLSSMAFNQYGTYISYLQVEPGTIGSEATTHHGYGGPLPISPISPLHPSPPMYYDSAYVSSAQEYPPVVPVSPLYAQPQVLDPRSATFGGEPIALAAPDGRHSPQSTSSSGSSYYHSDAESSAVQVPAPLMSRAVHTPEEGDSEREYDYESDSYADEDEGSDYNDNTVSQRRVAQRTALRRAATHNQVIGGYSNDGVGEDFYAPIGQRARSARPTVSAQPLPVPIPNLTKKSRGRRVPTASSLVVKVRRLAPPGWALV
jgi:hypothetical protein